MLFIHSLMLAAAIAIFGAEATSECWTNVHNETFAWFSSAPITYSFHIETASECEHWCGQTMKCQAWSYIGHSSQCDLYRATAVAIAPNKGFVYGGCIPKPTAGLWSEAVVSTSSHLPISSVAVAASSDAAASPSGVAHSKRGVEQHGHYLQHRYHSHR
ncbi:PAN-1 domain [Aspergillus tubingensis]|nr:PAN-1 domain [Aspergillus tubingensis]GFN19724.1 PAN-1 domain [Aspergillus tubingensis]